MIGVGIGGAIGAITLGAYPYHAWTKSFSPVYYTPGNTGGTYAFYSEDKQTKYFFSMTTSFSGMTWNHDPNLH